VGAGVRQPTKGAVNFKIPFEKHFLMSATHHDPRTTAALEKTKFGEELEQI